jgi:tetratricopeptide (TPR) repeat protein
MGDWLRLSFVEWLTAECASRPVVVILEDLHWGDGPSVTYLGEALHVLANKPFLVLALARPEVHELFPDLWKDAERHDVPLARLGPRAAERLVRAALGDSLASGDVSRVVERADGNPFYLEELIRGVAERAGETLPETVVALAQSRLERLEPEARRIVRAASVFGEVFWSGAVASLVGGAGAVGDLDARLEQLSRNEVISRAPVSRYSGERQFVFRHGLLREAAYAMLTESDRTHGHRLAGTWLEASGEKNAALLADHFERGGVPDRAVSWYRAAALEALEGNDLAGAISLCERGSACGATGETLGELCWINAEARTWRAEEAHAQSLALEALSLFPVGGAAWLRAAGTLASAQLGMGNSSDLQTLARRVLQAIGNTVRDEASAIGVAHVAFEVKHGEWQRALFGVLQAAYQNLEPGPLLTGWMHLLEGTMHQVAGRPELQLPCSSTAVESFRRAGHLRLLALALDQRAIALMDLGAAVEAEAAFVESVDLAKHLGLPASASTSVNLSILFEMQGRLDEAERSARASVESFQAIGNEESAGVGRSYLARVLVALGHANEAEAQVQRAMDRLPPIYRPLALAVLGEALLARERPAEALVQSAAAIHELESAGTLMDGSFVHRVHAQALWANGQCEEAKGAVRSARDDLRSRAAIISDPALRKTFLEGIPENARIEALAREWLS